MPEFVDLTNERFGRWIVLGVVSKAARCPDGIHRNTRWLCRCDCGTIREITGVRRSESCGCYKSEVTSKSKKKHGHTGDYRKGQRVRSRTYESWIEMRRRCERPHFKQYADYGGRGIKVCERWHKFEDFLSDMGKRPRGTTLDRFPNNDGDYEPGNCRWANSKQQAQTRRPRFDRTLVLFNGKQRPIKEVASLVGLKCNTLRARLRQGWPLDVALSLPNAGAKCKTLWKQRRDMAASRP